MALVQSLTFNIFFTLITSIIICFINNFIILKSSITNAIIIMFIFVFIINFLLGYYISFNSSLSHCNNYFNKVCLLKGFKQTFYTTLVYILIFFWSCPKSGFIGLMGDTFLTNSIAESFIIGLSAIAITIDNYFQSINDNCKLDFNTSAAAWLRIEKKLNNRKKKKGLKNLISITN